MAFDDDYRKLIEEARDAMRKLLDASDHQSWLSLRITYGDMCRVLEREDEDRGREDGSHEQAEQRERWQSEQAEQRERRGAWRRLPREQRENLVFQVLSDERCLIRELTSRLNLELGSSDRKRLQTLYHGDVRSLVMRMLRDGRLERVPEPFSGKVRYRYFRKGELEGPIIELEQAYRDEAA